MTEVKEYIGPITITRRGMGFFTIPAEALAKEGRANEEIDDLIIPRENLATALPYDTVKVVSIGMVPGVRGEPAREAGKVVEIVKRAREQFVGTVMEGEPGDIILHPDLKKMYVPLLLSAPDYNPGMQLPLGHKIVAKFTGWDEKRNIPTGSFIEDIGIAGIHETEMKALVLSQGFSPDFPPAVVADAKRLETEGAAMITAGLKGRKDFRGIPTFTIDPADAKDFDDALSVRRLEDGNVEVGIHIADVSYFVTPGTAIDKEARDRATSIYLVDRTIPMLPHILSNDLCSLNQDVDRLTVSAVFTLDKDANVIDRWFGETVIHSAKRFTYEEAQGVLDAGSGVLYDELALIRDFSKKIRARRVAKGAIEFDTAEVKVELNAEGKPIAIHLKERKETNMLIEDFMLLANEAVAEHLAKASKAANLPQGVIYRVHDAPDADRIIALSDFLRVMGYDLPTQAGRVKGADINKLLEKVKGTPEEYLIKTATLRSMAKAIYTTKNIGHFSLAFAHYTHFTSPIRRYPDVLTHRMVKHFEHERTVSKAEIDEFSALALHASEREVAATEAERDSIKLKIVEFMMDKVGMEFDGVISGVSDRGLYVELTETHAEGMIKIRDLGEDYFNFDEGRYRIVGERTKTEFRLGDPIRVKLTAARPLDRELDFALAESK
jgi:ribonuclease R